MGGSQSRLRGAPRALLRRPLIRLQLGHAPFDAANSSAAPLGSGPSAESGACTPPAGRIRAGGRAWSSAPVAWATGASRIVWALWVLKRRPAHDALPLHQRAHL